MRSFIETFSDFLTELRNNILEALSETNFTYTKLKAEKEQRITKLKSLVTLPLLDDYIDTLYAIAVFEINYCYLCGMRDSNMPQKVNPTGEDISLELNHYEKYTKWKFLASEQYTMLQSLLPSLCCTLLTQYTEIWDAIVGLEKQYCYSGGVFDKANLDKQFNPANITEWENLTDFFL